MALLCSPPAMIQKGYQEGKNCFSFWVSSEDTIGNSTNEKQHLYETLSDLARSQNCNVQNRVDLPSEEETKHLTPSSIS